MSNQLEQHRIHIKEGVDWDVTIVFPDGQKMRIEGRPSNAQENSNGTLDIVLPGEQTVSMLRRDLTDAPRALKTMKSTEHMRTAQQMLCMLPYGPYHQENQDG